MFVLSEFKDVVRIPPEQFHVVFKEAISNALNDKLANKVILNVGLCIVLYDIIDMKESFILPGDGASHTEVHFRFVVFRPFLDEIIIGRIKSCSREGVQVTLGFFEDILIPPTALQHPSRFDETEQAWIWEYQAEEGGDTHDLFFDVDERIKFRVTSEIFEESSPDREPIELQAGPAPAPEIKTPFKLIGTVSEPGLGLLQWW